MRVLVVQEDDGGIESLSDNLHRHGYTIARTDRARQALKTYHWADVVLLDLDLPDLDGLQFCKELRAVSDIPIIAVTARAAELDRILGLHAGLDDCVSKPYAFRELVARIEAVMRRANRQSRIGRDISHGQLHIDFGRRQVHLGGRLISLTAKEFDLLGLLACAPETVFSREEIMDKVWHAEVTNYSRTIDTHVFNLRRKLDAGNWIITVRGIGFRLGNADLG